MAETFRDHDHIKATEGIPGVPAGTPGMVIGSTGLSWVRYRVRFANGVERNLLDARLLTRSHK